MRGFSSPRRFPAAFGSLLWMAVAGVCSLASGQQPDAARIDFNRDVRPILVENCFRCHGFDEHSRQADLRLDVAEQAYQPRDGGAAIKPGEPDASEIWRRIISQDQDERMPPADSNLELNEDEKAMIRTWIEQGAAYARHWSFVAPQKVAPPVPPAGARVANEIDRFVIGQLAGSPGLAPSPEADRPTLIRRLGMDLIGLPPTPPEVEDFINDESPDAYEKMVDRLLDNPHFGERLALDWLDAARYADTNGYSIDGGRHMWLWRDWVINAFNTNKPYDEFLVEQIAGDLLPNATTDQVIATGFQRNNMVTHEGGTIPEENLTNYNADRVKTLGEAVLALTLGCAQCHDHKYDPITQRDYYSLFAYFNTVADVGLDGDGGVNPRPYIQAKTVLQTGEEAQLQTRIDHLKSQLTAASPSTEWEARQLAALEDRGRELKLLPTDVHKVSTPNRGAGFEVEDRRTVQITQAAGLAAYDVLLELPRVAEPITGIRIVFLPAARAPGQGWGYGPASQLRGKDSEEAHPKGNFVLTSLSVSVGEVPADQVDLHHLIEASQVTANAWSADQRPEACLVTTNAAGWSPPATHEGRVHLTLTFKEAIDARATPFLTAQLNFGAGDNLIAASMEILAMTGRDDGSWLTAEVIEALQTPPHERTDEQRRSIQAYYAAHAPELQRVRTDLANTKERLAVLTREFSAMVMNVAEKPRDTHVLRRGDYLQPTELVAMATPEFLPKADSVSADRLSLAQWITMPDHPLTARVYVNRLWQLMFGAGIVRTTADFGAQGEWPSHPELLDWLAVDFVENGWNVKALVKKICMSATYRQSSATTPRQLELDPQNRWIARGPRYRLPAELIRDAALRVSGLLRPELGGPSVNPYAPGDLWREISHFGSTPATAQSFVQDHGDKLYRRSLYTYWKRTAPPPNMTAFDAPNRETCVVSRPTTNTPLQALVLLNDVQFVEAARALGQQAIQNEGDDAARLAWAVLAALSRPATQHETTRLLAALERERSYYSSHPDEAKALVRVGESLADPNIEPSELAAWTQITLTVLNLSEVVTRN